MLLGRGPGRPHILLEEKWKSMMQGLQQWRRPVLLSALPDLGAAPGAGSACSSRIKHNSLNTYMGGMCPITLLVF